MAATQWSAWMIALLLLIYFAHSDHGAHSDRNDHIDHTHDIDDSDHIDHNDHIDNNHNIDNNDDVDHSDHRYQSEHIDDSNHEDRGDHNDYNVNRDHSVDGYYKDHDPNSDHGDRNFKGDYNPLGDQNFYRDHDPLAEQGVHDDYSLLGKHRVPSDHNRLGGHRDPEGHSDHETPMDHSVLVDHSVSRTQNIQSAQSSKAPKVVKKTEHIHAMTESGTVRGRLARDGNYFVFLGIPYAAAPTGSFRLKAPQPAPAWNGTLSADRTVICPQQGIGEEDCLILNVFVPKMKAKRLLPVLVYIHGGSFRYGFGPTRGVAPIVQQGVILVTINYRLGPLGFLCLGIDEAPGNAGLQDQLAALKWVNRNIKHFGGDTNSVTVYGTDSGAACVELLVLSKACADLFTRAVIESGSGGATWAIDDRPLCTAKNFAKAFSVSELEHPQKLLELYQGVPASMLTKVNEKFANTFTDGRYGFAPCVERPFEGVQSIITSPPSEIRRKEQIGDIPLMFIFASLEGLFLKSREYYALNYINRMEANFAEFLPYGLDFDNEIKRIEKAAEVRRFYFANETVENNKLGYLRYFGDSQVLRAVVGAAEEYARRGRRVYLMEFAHVGALAARHASTDDLHVNGAGHGSFNAHIILNETVTSDSDQLAIDRSSALLCNFVKYGEPTPNVTEELPVRWQQLRPPFVPYLRLGKHLQLLEAPYSERIQFWKQLFYDFGKRLPDHEPYFC